MAAIKQYLKKWWSEPVNKSLLLALLVMILVGFVISGAQKAQSKTESNESFSTDTIIPPGHVLIPIELANHESVSGLIGEFGMVDLYTSKGAFQKGGQVIGSHLRLIRAPLNPQQFALLIPEGQSAKILQAEGPYFAVVKNPKRFEDPEIAQHKMKIKARVEYSQ